MKTHQNKDIQLNVGNVWNIAQKEGPNIIGGPYIGGNYWVGVNEQNNGNGFGNMAYDNNGAMSNGGDHLPLVFL